MDYKSIEELRKNQGFNLRKLISVTFWIFVLFLVFLKVVVFQQVSVVGSSMEPNYFNGETLLVNQIEKNFKRGQVVAVFRDRDVAESADYFTRFQATFFLKRIIGLPNEEVEIKEDKVIIYNNQYPNGAYLEEDYISQATKKKLRDEKYAFPRTKVLNGEFFLMGDNRTNSFDSRNLGSFPEKSLFGVETVKVWPIDSFEFFSQPQYKFEKL